MIALYSQGHTLQLVAEITCAPTPSLQWAATFRRNLLAHHLIPDPPYFMFILPTCVYLWKKPATPQALPHWEAAVRDIADSLGWHSFPSKPPTTASGVETLALSWLRMLTRRGHIMPSVGRKLAWFVESGLASAVRNGIIRLDEDA